MARFGEARMEVHGTPGALRALLASRFTSSDVILSPGRSSGISPDGAGSLRYEGAWRHGRARGITAIDLVPTSSWDTDVFVRLHRPRGARAGLWSTARLARIAQEFAWEIRRTAARATKPIEADRVITLDRTVSLDHEPQPVSS